MKKQVHWIIEGEAFYEFTLPEPCTEFSIGRCETDDIIVMNCPHGSSVRFIKNHEDVEISCSHGIFALSNGNREVCLSIAEDAIVEFVDIAGLVKNAGKGEGLGNQFLSNIRSVNAILEVVRCFDDSNVVHVDGNVDPVRDVETINYELIFSDLEILDKRMKALGKNAAHGGADDKLIFATLTKAREILLDGSFIDVDNFSLEEQTILNSQDLLTTKKIMYVANVSEDDAATGNDYTEQLKKYINENYPKSPMVIISAKIESEIADFDGDERKELLETYGLEVSGIDKIIRTGYDLLDLIVYFTAGKKECRAWQIEKGTKAPQAAGKIHSDFERGFIRAEVTKYEKLMEAGNEVKAKELAYTKIEGKDYVIQDGDVVYFRFNV